MNLHPNTVSINDMMARMRGLKPMDRADAAYLRKCGWTVGKPATYATCTGRTDNGKRIDVTLTSAAQFWIDVNNDGPTYNIAHRVPTGHIISAAIIAADMLAALIANKPVAGEHLHNMTIDAAA